MERLSLSRSLGRAAFTGSAPRAGQVPIFGRFLLVVAGVTAAGSVFAAQIVRSGNPSAQALLPQAPTLEVEQSGATFQQTSDIFFKGKTTLDRGLDVGFVAEVRQIGGVCPRPGPSCSNESAVNQVYISVSGSLGKLGFGTNASMGDEMRFMAPYSSGYGRLSDANRSLHAFRALALTSEGLTPGAEIAPTPDVSYFTPRYGGVQLGVSFSERDLDFAPGVELGVLTPRELRDRRAASNVVGFAANYAHGFDHATLKLGGTYQATHDDFNAAITPDSGLRWAETRWGAGAQVDYDLGGGRGVSLSGSYRDLVSTGVGGDWLSNDSVWDAGVQYTQGRWSLGGYTIQGKSYSAEAGYQLGKGIQIAGGVQFWNLQTGNGLPAFDPSRDSSDTRATVVFIETALDF